MLPRRQANNYAFLIYSKLSTGRVKLKSIGVETDFSSDTAKRDLNRALFLHSEYVRQECNAYMKLKIFTGCPETYYGILRDCVFLTMYNNEK
jgi:hypothetical protein